MLSLIIALSAYTSPTYTLKETVIVSSPPRIVCTTRELIQGSGTVRTCETQK